MAVRASETVSLPIPNDSATGRGRIVAFQRGLAQRAAVRRLSVAAIALMTWPRMWGLEPGFDSAWRAGLHMAAHQGLDFGREIVFMYGPLGFLQFPAPYFAWTGLAAFAFSSFVHVAFVALVLHLASRQMPFWAALPATFLLAAVIVPVDPLLVGAVWLLVLPGGRRYAPVVGGMLAVAVLLKLNGAVVFGAVATWWMLKYRLAQLVVPTALGGFLALWLLARQSLGAIPGYVRGTVEVVTGYSSALQTNDLPEWRIWPALALIVGAIIASRHHRLPAIIILAGALKIGFVRHTPDHESLFFAALVLVTLASHMRAALVLTAIGAVMLLPRFTVGFGIVDAATSVVGQSENREEARQLIRATIPPDVIAAVGDRPVHVAPDDANVAWAFDLDWKPLPMFQSFTAYTEWLDDLNASDLRDRPRVVLHRAFRGAIDGRLPRFESPEEVLTLICHYRPTHGSVDGWMVYEPGPNRCGHGDDEMVVARFDGDRDWASLFYRGPLLGFTSQGERYRFVPGHAGARHLIAPPPCVNLDGYDLSDLTPPPGYKMRLERIPFDCR